MAPSRPRPRGRLAAALLFAALSTSLAPAEAQATEGLVLTSGFMGHGFMMAPIMGELLARHLLYDEEKELFENWNLRRYAEGKLLSESMILG